MKQDAKPIFVFPPIMMLALYLTVLGYMIPSIRETFSLSLAQAGLFSTVQSIGAVVSLILCFCVFSALNKTRVMGLGILFLGISILLFGVNTFVLVLYALFFFIGVFSTTVDTLANAIIADLAPKTKSFHIGLLHALWAATGVTGPFFAMLLGSTYTPVFIGLGILTILVSILFMAGLRNEARAPFIQNMQNMGAFKKLLAAFKTKGMPLFVITKFFSSFAQMSFIFFLSSFASAIRGQAFDGALVLSGLFIGNVIGRVCYAKFFSKLAASRIMPPFNALSVAALVALLFSGDVTLACILAVIGGFGFAANFPLLVVEACSLMPKDTSAAASLVFFGSVAASFAAPPIVGAIGDAAGLGTALLVSAAMLIPVVIVSAMLSKSSVAADARCNE